MVVRPPMGLPGDSILNDDTKSVPISHTVETLYLRWREEGCRSVIRRALGTLYFRFPCGSPDFTFQRFYASIRLPLRRTLFNRPVLHVESVKMGLAHSAEKSIAYE